MPTPPVDINDSGTVLLENDSTLSPADSQGHVSGLDPNIAYSKLGYYFATSMNNAGTVTMGYATYGSIVGIPSYSASITSFGGGSRQRLAVLPDTNDTTLNLVDTDFHGFIKDWDDDHITYGLSTYDNSFGLDDQIYANAINNAGQVLGNISNYEGTDAYGYPLRQATSAPHTISVVVWGSGGGQPELVAKGTRVWGSAINDNGIILGNNDAGQQVLWLKVGGEWKEDVLKGSGIAALNKNLQIVGGHVLYQNGHSIDLNTRIPAEYSVSSANAINEKGCVAATGSSPQGSGRALLLVPAPSFEAWAGEINHGFDPRPRDRNREPAWGSVVKGDYNDAVKLVIPEGVPPDKVTLVVPNSNAGDISVYPQSGFYTGDNYFMISAPVTDDDVTIATLEVHLLDAENQDTGQILATLKVMALPPRTVSLGIYRIEAPPDPLSLAQEVGGPTNDAIELELDEIYQQAGVDFQVQTSSNLSLSIDYDTYSSSNVSGHDGRVQEEEYDVIIANTGTQAGKARLFLLANSGIAKNDELPLDQREYGRGDTPEDAANLAASYCFVFTKTGFNNDTVAKRNAGHELGHVLGLTAVSPQEAGHHDPGPFPALTAPDGGLMKPGSGLDQPGQWMAHDDWKAANERARLYEIP